MAKLEPTWNNIGRLTVKPTDGELNLLRTLEQELDASYEVFFNSYLDGDRPDIVILKEGYGALIIEVKDWILKSYSLTSDNNWVVQDSIIRSPQAQVFRYKQNMFELHLPILGLKELKNKNFYNVINTYVYFHNASNFELDTFYSLPMESLKKQLNELNELRKNKNIEHSKYEKQLQYLTNRTHQLSRDRRISISKDNINKFISKIKDLRRNNLFTKDIYQDFIRRLSPPSHTLQQGLSIKFDSKQQSLTESKSETIKIKGVAGCGKTTILAQRAINAHRRHKGNILILTFNITLRHYIKDKISQIQCKGAENYFEIMHFHGFINNKLNEYGFDFGELLSKYKSTDKNNFDKLYSDRSIFESILLKEKYKTILIDEVQDYEPDWIKNIRDNFLDINGEMVLFGDQSQNIYERDDKNRESALVQGFGRWKKLTKSYRSSIDTPLIQLFKSFQERFLIKKYNDSEVFESTYIQGSMQFDLLSYEQYGSKIEPNTLFQIINRHIRDHKINPNDLAIICSKVEPLIQLNSLLEVNEKTKIMFEDENDLKSVNHNLLISKNKFIESIRRRKKCFFMQNSGLIKLSTTHSYKGLESETVFCILLEDDNDEMVYTGITRAKTNLVIFDCKLSKYQAFFKEYIP